MSNRTMDIHLLGRTFAVACPSGHEEQLLQVASDLNQRLEQLRLRTGTANLEHLTVMAALNLTHELTQATQQKAIEHEQMEERISMLQKAIEEALSDRTQNQPKRVDGGSSNP